MVFRTYMMLLNVGYTYNFFYKPYLSTLFQLPRKKLDDFHDLQYELKTFRFDFDEHP